MSKQHTVGGKHLWNLYLVKDRPPECGNTSTTQQKENEAAERFQHFPRKHTWKGIRHQAGRGSTRPGIPPFGRLRQGSQVLVPMYHSEPSSQNKSKKTQCEGPGFNPGHREKKIKQKKKKKSLASLAIRYYYKPNRIKKGANNNYWWGFEATISHMSSVKMVQPLWENIL